MLNELEPANVSFYLLNDWNDLILLSVNFDQLISYVLALIQWDKIRFLLISFVFKEISGVWSQNLLEGLMFAFQWVPEICHHCPRTPFLLVGTQVDLRDDSNTVEKLAKNKQRPMSSENGDKLARELKAVKYVECSALTQVLSLKIIIFSNWNQHNGF